MSNNNNGNKATANVAAPSLNIYKKVSIIRQPGDILNYEDTVGNLKTVSIQELGDAIGTTAVRLFAFDKCCCK